MEQISWVSDLEVILTGVATAILVAASIAWYRTYRKGTEQVQYEAITKVIEDYTKQIQPGANGGLSLTDLHIKFDAMFERQSKIIDDVYTLRQDVSTLKEAVVIIENDLEGIE